jgi:hypothetical protein
MLAALLARWVSGLVMPDPIYHVLSEGWRRPPPPPGASLPTD